MKKIIKNILSEKKELDWIKNVDPKKYTPKLGEWVKVVNLGSPYDFCQWLDDFCQPYTSGAYGKDIIGLVTSIHNLDKLASLTLRVYNHDENQFDEIDFPILDLWDFPYYGDAFHDIDKLKIQYIPVKKPKEASFINESSDLDWIEDVSNKLPERGNREKIDLVEWLLDAAKGSYELVDNLYTDGVITLSEKGIEKYGLTDEDSIDNFIYTEDDRVMEAMEDRDNFKILLKAGTVNPGNYFDDIIESNGPWEEIDWTTVDYDLERGSYTDRRIYERKKDNRYFALDYDGEVYHGIGSWNQYLYEVFPRKKTQIVYENKLKEGDFDWVDDVEVTEDFIFEPNIIYSFNPSLSRREVFHMLPYIKQPKVREFFNNRLDERYHGTYQPIKYVTTNDDTYNDTSTKPDEIEIYGWCHETPLDSPFVKEEYPNHKIVDVRKYFPHIFEKSDLNESEFGWIEDAYKNKWTFEDIEKLYYDGEIEYVKIIDFKDKEWIEGALEYCAFSDMKSNKKGELFKDPYFKIGGVYKILEIDKWYRGDIDCGWCNHDPRSIGHPCEKEGDYKTISLKANIDLPFSYLHNHFTFAVDMLELEPVLKN